MLKARAVAAFAVCLMIAAGCGNEPRVLPKPMSVTLPSVASRSRSQILDALCAGKEPPELQVAASAFETGSATPRSGDAQWRALIAQLAELRTDLDAQSATGSSCCLAPIRIEVTGFTDSTGDLATNQALSLARANTTKVAIVGVGFDPTTISALGGGVGGDDEADRRVAVRVSQDPAAATVCSREEGAG